MDLKLTRMILSRVSRFCGEILTKADEYRKEFVPRVMVGMVRAGSLVGASVARGMQKPGQKTKDVWRSLRRQLGSRLWDKREEAMKEAFSKREGKWVEARTPILVDLSDLSKKYARKMEHLGRVRDADESARRKTEVIEPGYWIFESYTFGWDEQTPIPLVDFGYSLEGGKYLSENEALGDGFRKIHRATGGLGVIVMDRRADADYVLQTLEGLPMAFSVRLRGDRIVEDEEGRRLGSVREVAQGIRLEGDMEVKRRMGSRTRKVRIEYGWREVRVPGLKRRHWLVVAHGRFEHVDREETHGGWYVLTTEPIREAHEAERILRWYRLRWKAEEAIEFIKSALGLETVRMLRWRRIRRLIDLAFWVMALLAEVLADLAHSTRRKLYELGQVLKELPANFLLYRIHRALAIFFGDPNQRQRLETISGKILGRSK